MLFIFGNLCLLVVLYFTRDHKAVLKNIKAEKIMFQNVGFNGYNSVTCLQNKNNKNVNFSGNGKQVLKQAKKLIDDPIARQRFTGNMQYKTNRAAQRIQVTLEDVPVVLKEDIKKVWEVIKDFINGNGPKGPGGGGGGGKYETMIKMGNREAIPITIPKKH